MGVKNLMKLLEKKVPGSISYKKITDYKNKKFGVDANLLIYKIVFAIRKNGYDLKKGDIITTHIHGFLQKLIAFKKYNIKTIFVFDSYFP